MKTKMQDRTHVTMCTSVYKGSSFSASGILKAPSIKFATLNFNILIFILIKWSETHCKIDYNLFFLKKIYLKINRCTDRKLIPYMVKGNIVLFFNLFNTTMLIKIFK